MQPPHTIAESRQEPTPDIPSCGSVSKSLEKWDGVISGTVPFLYALEYIVFFRSNKNKYISAIKKMYGLDYKNILRL